MGIPYVGSLAMFPGIPIFSVGYSVQLLIFSNDAPKFGLEEGKIYLKGVKILWLNMNALTIS